PDGLEGWPAFILGRLHVTVTTGGGYVPDLIHYTTSLLITAVLLVLTLRAARFSGTPLANIFFAIAGILWSCGGLTRILLLAPGVEAPSPSLSYARALQYTGAVVFPVSVLMVWRPFAREDWQKTASRWLEIGAAPAAVAVAAMWWFSG